MSIKKEKDCKNSLQRNRLQPIRNLLNKKKNQRSTGRLPTLNDVSSPGKEANTSSVPQTTTSKNEGQRNHFENNESQEEVNESPTPADDEIKSPQIEAKKSSNSNRKGVKATPGKDSKYVSYHYIYLILRSQYWLKDQNNQ